MTTLNQRGTKTAYCMQPRKSTTRRKEAMSDEIYGRCRKCFGTCTALGEPGKSEVLVMTLDIARSAAEWCHSCKKVFCGRCCGAAVGAVALACPICGGIVGPADKNDWKRSAPISEAEREEKKRFEEALKEYRRKEDEKQSLRADRREHGLCVVCGKPLGLFNKLLRRTFHRKC